MRAPPGCSAPIDPWGPRHRVRPVRSRDGPSRTGLRAPAGTGGPARHPLGPSEQNLNFRADRRWSAYARQARMAARIQARRCQMQTGHGACGMRCGVGGERHSADGPVARRRCRRLEVLQRVPLDLREAALVGHFRVVALIQCDHPRQRARDVVLSTARSWRRLHRHSPHGDRCVGGNHCQRLSFHAPLLTVRQVIYSHTRQPWN